MQKRTMARGAAVAAAAAAVMVGATGCTSGSVVGKTSICTGADINHPKECKYQLDVRDAQTGKTAHITVAKKVYKRCGRGESYPACAS